MARALMRISGRNACPSLKRSPSSCIPGMRPSDRTSAGGSPAATAALTEATVARWSPSRTARLIDRSRSFMPSLRRHPRAASLGRGCRGSAHTPVPIAHRGCANVRVRLAFSVAVSQRTGIDSHMMDVQTRRAIALELLQEQGEVSVAELSDRTGVSCDDDPPRSRGSSRRRAPLRRVHGGAIGLASRGYAAPYSVRPRAPSTAKERIGQAAAATAGGARDRRAGRGHDDASGRASAESDSAISPCSRPACASPGALWPAPRHPPHGHRRPRCAGRALSGGRHGRRRRSRGCGSTRFVMGVGGIDVEAGVHGVQPRGRTRQARSAGKRASLHRRRRQLQARQGHVRAGLPARASVDVVVTDSDAAREDIEALQSEHVEVVVA